MRLKGENTKNTGKEDEKVSSKKKLDTWLIRPYQVLE